MTTSGAALLKAGANVSTVFTGTEANTNWDIFIAQAESFVNALTRINYSDTYTGLNTDKREILSEVVSNLAAMYAISYDMSGYTSRLEAGKMLDVLRDGATRGLSLLRDKKQTDFIDGA